MNSRNPKYAGREKRFDIDDEESMIFVLSDGLWNVKINYSDDLVSSPPQDFTVDSSKASGELTFDYVSARFVNDKYNLGMSYVSKNSSVAESELKKAANADEKSSPEAMYELGNIYRSRGDKELAVEWYTKAMEKNNVDSRKALADIYVEGLKKYLDKENKTEYKKSELENDLEKCNEALKLYDEKNNNEEYDCAKKISSEITRRKKNLDNGITSYKVLKTKRHRTEWSLGWNGRWSTLYRNPADEGLPLAMGTNLEFSYGIFPWMFAALDFNFLSLCTKLYDWRPAFTFSPMFQVGLNTDLFGRDWMNVYVFVGGGAFLAYSDNASLLGAYPKIQSGIGFDFYPHGRDEHDNKKDFIRNFFLNIEYSFDYTVNMGFEDRVSVGFGWYLDQNDWRKGIWPSFRNAERPED